ncbi:MAG: hypothetical protein KatS3mg098_305 [Candidatus Parcubacteria bacterium]|nr:MAG: hypothetical protein KatS3mg098_305 [Candidatus Parcubacteria bacterium]
MTKILILAFFLLVSWPIIFIFKGSHSTPSLNFLYPLKDGEIIEVIFKDKTIQAEAAVSSLKKEKGLSQREELSENQGMIFVFERPQIPFFWMKDMKFALDFIWINQNQIVDLAENIPPPSRFLSPQIVYPKEKVDKVLEVKAGTIKKLNLKKGDLIEFRKIKE